MNKQHYSTIISLSRIVLYFLLSVILFAPAWSVNRGGLFIKELHSVAIGKSELPRIAASRSSSRIAVATSDNAVHIYDATTLSQQPSLSGADKKITSISFSHDGLAVIAATVEGKIYSWNVATGAVIKSFKPISSSVIGLDPLIGNQVLITASDGNLLVCDWATGESVSSLPQLKETISCQCVHPDGHMAVFGTSSGRVLIYGLAQSQDVKVLLPGSVPTTLEFSPDSSMLIAGSSDGIVRVWNVDKWVLKNNVAAQHGGVTVLAIDPQSRWIVSSAKDSALKIYSLKTGEQLKTIIASDVSCFFASFVSDNVLCVATSGGILKSLAVEEVPPDSLSPNITIVCPLVDINTSTSKAYGKEYVLEGVAYDDSMIAKVTVNGIPVQLFDLDPSDTLRFPPNVKKKGFRATVSMDSLGINQVEVKAIDESDNVGSVTLGVRRLQRNDAVEIVASTDTGEVDKTAARVKFRLWLNTISYSVSNNLIEVASNSEMRNKTPGVLTTVDVPLYVGYNQIQIAAVSTSGERVTKTIGVNRRISKATSSPQASSQGRIGMQRWAAVVGISHYASTDISQLGFADADARDFAAFLQTPQGGGFESDHMRVYLNQDATLANVKDALYNFVAQAIDSDLVVIYFAGHGAPNPLRPDQLYLLAYDSDPNLLRTTAVPMWDIQTVLDRYINAKKVVVFSDACHSGAISIETATRGLGSAKSNPINQYLTNLARAKNGVVIFTASAQNEVSQESQELGHGVFTYYLLEGLKGKADLNNDYVVTINELMTYVEDKVKRTTKGYQNPTRSQTNYDKNLPMSTVDH